MLKQIPRVYWAAAIIAAVIAFYIYSGFQRHRGGERTGQSVRLFGGNDFDIPFSRFAGAETFRSATSKELIAEIEKVIDQEGLPADVFRGLSSIPEEERQRLLQSTNIAVTLHVSFRDYYEIDSDDPKKLPKDDLEKLWAASPLGTWDIDKETLDRVRPTLTKFELRQQALRNELKQTRTTHFYYIFESSESLGSFSYGGTRVNTGASKYLADYALLEEYAIAQALLDGNIKEAIDSLAYIFRITYLASKLQDVGTRTDAAHVRLRAFNVMQRVVLDPNFERQHMIFLRTMLAEQYQNWTSEYAAWFGDRARTLMLYQHITMDGFENALEPEELRTLERRNMLDAAIRGFRMYHEDDKIFYLRSMQKILDISREPLIKRQDVLNQINRERRSKEYTYDENGVSLEPFVANLRLQNVDRFMRLFVQDRSAVNRALVAVLHSLGQTNTNSYRDPFTGEPYEVRRVEDLPMVEVKAADLPQPFRVPVFAGE